MTEKWIVSFTDQYGEIQQIVLATSSKAEAVRKIQRIAQLRHMEDVKMTLMF